MLSYRSEKITFRTKRFSNYARKRRTGNDRKENESGRESTAARRETNPSLQKTIAGIRKLHKKRMYDYFCCSRSTIPWIFSIIRHGKKGCRCNHEQNKKNRCSSRSFNRRS